MDEDRARTEATATEEFHPGRGSFFQMKRTWFAMIVIAIIVVFWGMGGRRDAQDKSGAVYSAEQRQAEEADRTAGFGRSDPQPKPRPRGY
jgi:hypothetical protein